MKLDELENSKHFCELESNVEITNCLNKNHRMIA